MTLDELLQGLRSLDAAGIATLRERLAAAHRTVADEVDAWGELITVDAALRRHGRSREAAIAAHRAAQAVRTAAVAAGIALPDPEVTRVAREVAVLARALVAGDLVTGRCPHLASECETVARVAVA